MLMTILLHVLAKLQHPHPVVGRLCIPTELEIDAQSPPVTMSGQLSTYYPK